MLATEQYTINTGRGRPVKISYFGCVDYPAALAAMTDFANNRTAEEIDRIWVLEHSPVYTLGTSCDQSTLFPSEIPIVKTDRGGQITYHGEGQLVMYPLLKLKDHAIGIKQLVSAMEQTVIDILAEYGINATRWTGAPGVYVDNAKIAALGLRIRRGTSYHGLSFNIDMDVEPFKNIDPCGFEGLKVTQLADLVDRYDMVSLRKKLPEYFARLI